MQPGIRITRAEVETLGGFLMAARGAIAIRHPAAATSAIDAARAILDRVSGEQDDPPAAEPPPAQPVVDAQTPVSAPHAYPLALASEQWQRPDDETRAQLLSASLTSASDTETHDRAAQLAFALSLSREAYLEAHPMASWDDEHPSFLTNSPLQGFFRLFLRIFERGLREGEVVLERQTEGRITGLVVFAEVHGRRVGHTVVQLLGFASRARLGEHLHRELVRDVRRRHPPPITLRLEVANCISELSWFYFWEYVQMRVEMECCSLRHRAEYLRRRSFPSAAAKREEILRDRAKDPHGMRKIVHQRAGMLDCAQRFLCARLDYQRLAEDFESETVREGMRLLSMTMNQSQSRMYHAYNGFDAALREFENRIPRDQIEARCHTIPPGGIRAVPGHEAWTAEETVCSICIAPVEEPGSVACLLDCRHAFHLDCVESWLHTNATCPNCRCAVGVATEEVEDEEEPSSDAEDAGGGSDAIPGGRNAASGAAARESLAEALGPHGPEVLDASEAFAVQMERFMDPDAEIPSDEERRMHDAMRFAYNQMFESDGEYEEEEEEEEGSSEGSSEWETDSEGGAGVAGGVAVD